MDASHRLANLLKVDLAWKPAVFSKTKAAVPFRGHPCAALASDSRSQRQVELLRCAFVSTPHCPLCQPPAEPGLRCTKPAVDVASRRIASIKR